MDVSTLSDSALDAAYHSAWTNNNFTLAQIYGAEITTRLISPIGFVASFFETFMTRFPYYEADSKFSASGAARQAVGQGIAGAPQVIITTTHNAAVGVAKTVGEMLGGVTTPLADAVKTPLILIVAGLGIVAFIVYGKK